MTMSVARQRLLEALRAQRSAARDWPLTADQQAIWLAERLDPARTGYHVTCAVRLTGPLDEPAMDRALTDMSDRHQALRCRIVERDSEPRQSFDGRGPALSRSDLRSGPPEAGAKALHRLITADSGLPF